MSKAAIITFHRADNYGATLQAYAMLHILASAGVNAELLDYRNKEIEESYKLFRLGREKSAARKIRVIAHDCFRILKRLRFAYFRRRYLRMGKRYTDTTVSRSNGEYDTFITGSDQVWNDDCSRADPAYCLTFAADGKCLLSYAASFGYDDIPAGRIAFYKQALSRFQELSVREQAGVQIISSLLNRPAALVLDPTLMLDSEDWDALAKPPCYRNYILVYLLNARDDILRFAVRLSEKTGCPIVYITDERRKTISARSIHNAGPREFLGLFSRASYVVTNSFHGLAFSVAFKKPMYVDIPAGERTTYSRLTNLMELLHLHGRYLAEMPEVFTPAEVDFEAVYEKLKTLRRESLNFLTRNICPKEKTPALCESCEGCSLCTCICPQKAIGLVPDEKGFLKAQIAPKRCTACGLCESICTQKHGEAQPPQRILAASHKDKNVVKNSASGGVFTALSDAVLGGGGVVYGAVFDGAFSVRHARAYAAEGRDTMRGSKYVQSDMGDVFTQVVQDLSDGKQVLFTGTPCQVDGLKLFLKERKVPMENLFTCDLICNGVSSPQLWGRYVRESIGIRHIKSIHFRYKADAVKGSVLAVVRRSGRLDVSGYYAALYARGLCISPSCYSCRYAKRERYGDVSLGDYQGQCANGALPEPETYKSVVLVNTGQGKRLFELARGSLRYRELTGGGYSQKRLCGPAQRPEDYNRFWHDAKSMRVKRLLKKYAGKSVLEDIRRFLQGHRILKAEYTGQRDCMRKNRA